MNITEFEALKPGDKVRNAQGHEADVRHAGDYGVQVQWGGNGPLFTLYRAGRIWVGMELVRPDCIGLDKCEREDCKRAEQCLGGSTADYAKLAGA